MSAELDAALDLANGAQRKADTIRVVVAGLRLALTELDVLRPLHYGRDDSRGDRDPVKLGTEAEHYVKEELACLPLARRCANSIRGKRETHRQTIEGVIDPLPSTGTCSAPMTVSSDDASALNTSG